MWNNSHRTTSGWWWKAPNTEKGKPISSEWGRAKDKLKKKRERERERERQRILGQEPVPWGGIREGGKVSKLSETLSQAEMGGASELQRGRSRNRCLDNKTEIIHYRDHHWTALPSQEAAYIAALQTVGAGCSGSGFRGQNPGWGAGFTSVKILLGS